MKPSDYILTLKKNRVEKFEKIGFTVYAVGDGTYHAVDPDAPQEAHNLAMSAIEGYPDAVDEVRGFKVPLPKSYNGNSADIEKASKLK